MSRMLGHRLANDMKKERPAKSATRVARKAMSAGNGKSARDAERSSIGGKNLTKTLHRLFTQEALVEARTLIEKELVRDPESHWLLARLSTTFYEERQYEQALRQIERAYRLAPDCPLVLWDYAGTLDAVGRTAEAIELYGRLLGKGVEAVAYEECGEGISWAIALLTDCCFRLGAVPRAPRHQHRCGQTLRGVPDSPRLEQRGQHLYPRGGPHAASAGCRCRLTYRRRSGLRRRSKTYSAVWHSADSPSPVCVAKWHRRLTRRPRTFPGHGVYQCPQEGIDRFRRPKELGNVRIQDDGTAARLHPSRKAIGTRFAVVKAVLG